MWLYEKKIKTSTKKLSEHFFVHLCNTNLKLIIYQCFFISWTFLCQFQDLQNERVNISSWFTANFTVLLEMNILKLLLSQSRQQNELTQCVFRAICTECLPFLGGECCCYVNSSIVYCTFYSCKYIVCLFLIILSSKYLPSR